MTRFAALAAPRRRRLRPGRPGSGPLALLMLLPTYVVLGAALVAYVLGIVAVAVLAVVVATLRLLLTPPLVLLARAPGVRHLRERRALRRYARHGVQVIEDQLRARAVSARRAARGLPDAPS